MKQQSYAEGEKIFEQGDPSEYVYRIVSGEVEVYAQLDGKQIVLGSAGEGELLGEMGIIEGRERSASVRAVGPVEAQQLERWEFFRLISEDTHAAFRLIERLSDRLRDVTSRLVEATLGADDPEASPPVPAESGSDARVTLFAAGPTLRGHLPDEGLPLGELPFAVGRASQGPAGPGLEVHLELADTKPYRLSRRHFCLSRLEDGYAVVDLGSTLGTEVNGEFLGQAFGRDSALLAEGENTVTAGGAGSSFTFRVVLEPA